MTEPFTEEQRVVLAQIESDGKIAAWLDARRETGSARFRSFWLSPETLRSLLTALIIPLVLGLAGWAWSLTPMGRAAAQESRAREEVDEVSKLLPAALASGDGRRIVRIVLNTRAQTDKDPQSVVARTLAAFQEQAKSVYGAAPPPVQNAPPPPPAATITPVQARNNSVLNNSFVAPGIVYIQIYADAQKADAQKVVAALNAQAVPVAGIENVLTTHPDLDLRYAQRGRIGVRFYRQDDRRAADYVAAQIAQTLDEPVATQDLSGRPTAAAVKAGLVEVWFPVAAS